MLILILCCIASAMLGSLITAAVFGTCAAAKLADQQEFYAAVARGHYREPTS